MIRFKFRLLLMFSVAFSLLSILNLVFINHLICENTYLRYQAEVKKTLQASNTLKLIITDSSDFMLKKNTAFLAVNDSSVKTPVKIKNIIKIDKNRYEIVVSFYKSYHNFFKRESIFIFVRKYNYLCI